LIGIVDDLAAGFDGYQQEDPSPSTNRFSCVDRPRQRVPLPVRKPAPAYSNKTQRLRTPTEIIGSNRAQMHRPRFADRIVLEYYRHIYGPGTADGTPSWAIGDPTRFMTKLSPRAKPCRHGYRPWGTRSGATQGALCRPIRVALTALNYARSWPT
jgi:hypothetical protein